MGNLQYAATIRQLAWQEQYYANHEPTADEIFDRVWFEKCILLRDRIKALETQAEALIAKWEGEDGEYLGADDCADQLRTAFWENNDE